MAKMSSETFRKHNDRAIGAVCKKVHQNAAIDHYNGLVNLVFNFGAAILAGIEFRSLARQSSSFSKSGRRWTKVELQSRNTG
jgi:hypothetical protein